MFAELPFLESSTKGGDVNYTNLKKKKTALVTEFDLASTTDCNFTKIFWWQFSRQFFILLFIFIIQGTKIAGFYIFNLGPTMNRSPAIPFAFETILTYSDSYSSLEDIDFI